MFGLSMGDLTVLDVKVDPYRLDTDAYHRAAAWFRDRFVALVPEGKIHIRGLHYRVLGHKKPDGSEYRNSDEDYAWLQGGPGKAARWLGYVPFAAIEDKRNAAPVILRCEPKVPFPYIGVGDLQLPDAYELEPYVALGDFEARQPFKLVLFGEKSSLEAPLTSLGEEIKADLYLMTGEISDTLVHTMAKEGAEDGRPMIVLTFADCDPGGWQMPISIGRKLQAFKDLEFPDLRFQVHRVGLLPEQVRELGLPSTPLKEKEKRADRWKAHTGLEQTEIDALIALHPGQVERMGRVASLPFFDRTLDRRAREVREAWEEEAQAVLEQALNSETLDQIREQAADRLAELEEEIEAIRQQLHVDPGDVELPQLPELPEPELPEEKPPEPLIDSDWSWEEQTLALKRSKDYGKGTA
jgi:hypothetical protein